MSYVTPRVSSKVIDEKLQKWAREDVTDVDRIGTAFGQNTLDLYSHYLGVLEKFRATTGRRLLDVGCSTGAFLTVAANAGWQAEGVDVGAASVEYARGRLGLQVHHGTLYGYEPPHGEPYDVIVMLEVIEHLEAPSRGLEKVRSLLSPGGLFLVSTPNFDSLFRRLFGTGWWVVNCEEEHIMLYTPRSLRRQLERNGFEILFERIRGIDVIGIMRNFARGTRSEGSASGGEGQYYAAREAKNRIKDRLGRSGLITIARAAMRQLDRLFSSRWSPLYGFGEQIVMVCRKA